MAGKGRNDITIGVDYVVVEEFSLTFAGYSPRWFATEVLHRRLSAHICRGWL